MNLRFKRGFQDREVSEFQRLIDFIGKLIRWIIPMFGGGALGNNKVFSVKSSYEKLLVREEIDFPCNAIGVTRVLRKACFFT